jgi:hypothetical protein
MLSYPVPGAYAGRNSKILVSLPFNAKNFIWDLL